MISALVLMCAVHSFACRSNDARAIAAAIDAATDSTALRAHLVIAAWRESEFRVNPRPISWDAKIGLAVGPWQEWDAKRGEPLLAQARRWLWLVQRGGLAGLSGSGPAAARIAARRAHEAERLVEIVGESATP